MKLEDTVKKYVLRDLEDRGREVKSEDIDEFTDIDLLRSGILDSLGVPRLVVFLEQELSVQIPLEDVNVENFSSIKSISLYLEHLMAETI